MQALLEDNINNDVNEQESNNSINEIFDDLNNEESIFYLKRRLLSYPELSKDTATINLIFSICLYNDNLSKNKIKSKKDEKIIENLKKQIFTLIKNHNTFHYFLYNNHIDDKTLIKIIPYMKYEYILKDNYFSKEGDNSTKMYFILKGKVSFRKKVNSLKTPNIVENQKYVLGDNENFGHWDIIYERKRKLSFYTLENCHLISIEKDILKKYLEEKIVKGDLEKKSFITKFLRNHMTLAAYRIDVIIQNMKILHFKKGEIVYKEGDINKSIYLIYKGEVKFIKKINKGEFHLIGKLNENISNLQKKAKKIDYAELIKNDNDEENNNINSPNYNYNMKYLKIKKEIKESKYPKALDLLLEKQIYHDIVIMGKGGLGGLEITTGVLKYKYTMISNSDYTTIFQLELKNVEEHLKEFMLNLLPIFLQNEKEIHSRIKHIKYIDNNIIPLNCQKFKINNQFNNNNLLLNSFENNGIFMKEIQKINEKFDTNEGGFIKMNDFNINLNNQRNLLKDQLKDNKMKDIQVYNLIKEYDENEKYKLRYSGVRMRSKPHSLDINENISNFKSKNDNKNNYNGLLSERTKYPQNYFSNYSSNKKFFIFSNKKKFENNKNNLVKNMSQRDITKKTLKIFDKIIDNYRKRKEFLKLDIFSPQILRTDSSDRRKKTINNKKNKESMLFKEVIILKNKNDNYKEYKTYSINNDKSFKNINNIKHRHMSGRTKINKKINKLLMKELNIYKYEDNDYKENDDDLYIVNRNFLKRLFDKNMNKKKKQKTINTNNFNRNYHTKRMIYYNTGMYDMPFVSHLNLINRQTINKFK